MTKEEWASLEIGDLLSINGEKLYFSNCVNIWANSIDTFCIVKKTDLDVNTSMPVYLTINKNKCLPECSGHYSNYIKNWSLVKRLEPIIIKPEIYNRFIHLDDT